MLDSLAFLPEADIPQGLAWLRTIMPQAAGPLVDYFDRTYVTGQVVQLGNGNQRHIPPQFPPDLWCVHDETLNNFPRTNNYSEGWNMKYKLAVGQAHPTFFKSVETIQLENEQTLTKIEQTRIGNPPTKKTQTRYENLQRRLNNLCTNYSNQAVVTPAIRERFIRAIGHNIKLERS